MPETSEHSLPLTTAQRGLWVGQKIAPADATMNIAEVLEIRGPIEPDIFRQALLQVTSEAETLRVRIIEENGRPSQVVRPEYPGEFPCIDFSQEADPRASIDAWMLDELSRPVDLANDPLWVSALFKAADDCYFWYQRAHHVIFDGYSGGCIARRVAELYSARIAGQEPSENPFGSLQALVEAETSYRDSSRCQRDRDYWKQQLADLPEAVTLARNPHQRSMGGLRRSIGHLSTETARRLRALGKQTATSLPQVLIALIAAYYHRTTGANDLVIGMPVSGRINAALRRSPGMVANAVTLRLHFSPGMSAVELFAQVAQVVKQSLRHQQYRYEELRRDLGLVSRGQHMAWLGVNIEPFDYQLDFGGAKVIPHNVSNGSAEDLTVFVYDRGDESALRFDFDANPTLYSMAELDEHRRRLVRLIDAVLEKPERALQQIDILGPQERHRQLVDWNDTCAPIEAPLLPALLARQAQLCPQATAVICGGAVVSYRQLHERSVRQACQWIADGIRPGDIVAVALPRSEQLLVVLLAIMRTGAAYLPLDPEGPIERTMQMLDDAAPVALVAQPEWHARMVRGGIVALVPERFDTEPPASPGAPDHATADGVAYVLYTSGSTGRPKGVEVTHRNLGNFLQGMRAVLAPQAGDRVLAVTTVTFDIATLELFLPLTVGARTVIAHAEDVRHPTRLARLVKQHAITHMQATPSLWKVLLSCADMPLRDVHALVGGEKLHAELANQLVERAARVTQFYGPTETTVWSTAFEVTRTGTQAPPIGRPILNTRLYVLDEALQLVPTGAAGELYIGGAGVARGYLHRSQLNQERFVEDPFAGDGSRMYRTGDRVRWHDDGNLAFIERIDRQLKIRGHRIEPGEIESQLLHLPDIGHAAVTAHTDLDHRTTLVAYVVPSADAALDSDKVRAALAPRLPEYMIPSRIIPLDSMPLLPSGKLDRRALPSPDPEQRPAYAAPVTPVEKKLAGLWQQIFGIERIGRHDNFFELGGDSLTAAEMVARFPEHFSIELPLGSLFEASTVAGLASYLQRAGSDSDPLGPMLPLRLASNERPLFCIHPVVGLSWSYANLLRHLEPGLPVYGLQAIGLRGDAPLPASLSEIAAQYIAQLRRIQVQGPYRLLGWSLGGLIAHEITAQLQAQGQQVELLAMLDAFPFVTAEAQPFAREVDEVQAVMRFLGFEQQAQERDAFPASMESLADWLCREYDVFSMPLVQEMIKRDPQLMTHVSAVTRNHLRLARQHVPRPVKADVLMFQAAAQDSRGLEGVFHNQPAAWQPFVHGRMDVHAIDCRHQSMLDPAPSAVIGRCLQKKLETLRVTATLSRRSHTATQPSSPVANYA